ncbi:hypothetical protein BAU18_001587 [Enterococcus diestrammenae]|uniref:Uncharacterized protein n=2 Tax=Enterococcus TaxID=1350 RepID=A0ABV0F1R1_9ENTE|nr:hypothetical protein BAU18_06060 [Enterococcus diestrammenae]
MISLNFLATFFLSFISTLLVICYILYFWKNTKKRFLDYPSNRKLHSNPTLLLGGVGIFIGILLSSLFVNILPLKIQIISFLVLCIGLLDDFYKSFPSRGISVLTKTLGISLAIGLTFFSGYRISSITIPFSSNPLMLSNLLSFVFTFLWFFTIMTIINFTDGLDGLAGSIVVIIGFVFLIVALVQDKKDVIPVIISIIGAVSAFLMFNFPNAKIFLGDSGALLLGYYLAFISINSFLKEVTFRTALVPLLAFIVPLVDNLRVIIVRLKSKKKIYEADRNQIHLFLQDRGWSKGKVLLTLIILVIVSGLFSILSIF